MTGNTQKPEAETLPGAAANGDAPGAAQPPRPDVEPPDDQTIADTVVGNWVDTRAHPDFQPYLRLSRIDRPIGTWLLLLPCWWGALLGALAAPETAGWLTVWIFIACGLGAVLMRGAGSTWNDITDLVLDPRDSRTRRRPLDAGHRSQREPMASM